jgi:hypothetical protein
MNAQTVQEEPSSVTAPLDKVEDGFNLIYIVIGLICLFGFVAAVLKLKN